MQLVLHGGEKSLGGLRRDVVINRRCINIGDLLVELALGEADFPNALQLLFKISFGKYRTVILQALIVHRVALDVERLNNGIRPFAELHGAFRTYLVSDCDGRGEVVVLGVVDFAVCGSYSKISNN